MPTKSLMGQIWRKASGLRGPCDPTPPDPRRYAGKSGSRVAPPFRLFFLLIKALWPWPEPRNRRVADIKAPANLAHRLAAVATL